MAKPDLTQDIVQARAEIKPHVDRLKGLLQMWHMFQTAKLVADEFIDKFDQLSYQLKIACTRSLVVDYLKPWTGNRSPEINTLKDLPWRDGYYSFLATIIATDEHDQLSQLRHKIVAHLDEDFEGGGITIKGIMFENKPVNRPQDNGTLDNVFVPAVSLIKGVRGIWWLSNKEKIKTLRDHIVQALKLTEQETHQSTQAFRATCFEHVHVLRSLDDLFGIVEFDFAEGMAEVTRQTERPHPLEASNPENLEIGNQNIQSLITVYEPRPKFPENKEILGKGYRLIIGAFNKNGKIDLNVVFPKYPYPKEPIA